MRKIAREPKGAGRFSPGEDLVIAGAVGKAGVLEALSVKHNVLETRFTADFLSLAGKKAMEHLNLTPEFLLACGATEWEEAAEGGVFAALWNISRAAADFSKSSCPMPGYWAPCPENTNAILPICMLPSESVPLLP